MGSACFAPGLAGFTRTGEPGQGHVPPMPPWTPGGLAPLTQKSVRPSKLMSRRSWRPHAPCRCSKEFRWSSHPAASAGRQTTRLSTGFCSAQLSSGYCRPFSTAQHHRETGFKDAEEMYSSMHTSSMQSEESCCAATPSPTEYMELRTRHTGRILEVFSAPFSKKLVSIFRHNWPFSRGSLASSPLGRTLSAPTANVAS